MTRRHRLQEAVTLGPAYALHSLLVLAGHAWQRYKKL